jgi:hypothetical protein
MKTSGINPATVILLMHLELASLSPPAAASPPAADAAPPAPAAATAPATAAATAAAAAAAAPAPRRVSWHDQVRGGLEGEAVDSAPFSAAAPATPYSSPITSQSGGGGETAAPAAATTDGPVDTNDTIAVAWEELRSRLPNLMRLPASPATANGAPRGGAASPTATLLSLGMLAAASFSGSGSASPLAGGASPRMFSISGSGQRQARTPRELGATGGGARKGSGSSSGGRGGLGFQAAMATAALQQGGGVAQHGASVSPDGAPAPFAAVQQLGDAAELLAELGFPPFCWATAAGAEQVAGLKQKFDAAG